MVAGAVLCTFIGVWLGWILHDWADGEPEDET